MGDTELESKLNTDSAGLTLSISNECCTNGDKSLKCVVGATSGNLGYKSELGIGETVTFTVDTISEKALKLCIYTNINGAWAVQGVTIPSGEQTTSITHTIPDTTSQVWYRIDKNELTTEDYYFTDNWKLTIQ